VTSETIPLFSILELKKDKLSQYLKKRLCGGIEEWGISEKVCGISLWILIYVNISCIRNRIG
jgi:hypothetical protein